MSEIDFRAMALTAAVLRIEKLQAENKALRAAQPGLSEGQVRLLAQTMAKAMYAVHKRLEFYTEREANAPANHQEFREQAKAELQAFNDALVQYNEWAKDALAASQASPATQPQVGKICKYCGNKAWSPRYFRADTTPTGMWWHERKDGDATITMPCNEPAALPAAPQITVTTGALPGCTAQALEDSGKFTEWSSLPAAPQAPVLGTCEEVQRPHENRLGCRGWKPVS